MLSRKICERCKKYSALLAIDGSEETRLWRCGRWGQVNKQDRIPVSCEYEAEHVVETQNAE